jgi:dipeptidyl aminopeptidase/acylaminoacyl peptidase
MFPSWANDTVTRKRPTYVKDSHGNQTADWSLPTADAVIRGCSVQPGASEELLGGRDTTLIDWTVYAPSGVDVTATDGVEVDGVLYQVNGSVKRWPSPTGATAHVMFELRRWEG